MKKILVVCMLCMVLGACGLTKKSLGMARSTPDDGFNSRKERLVIPPEYNVRP